MTEQGQGHLSLTSSAMRSFLLPQTPVSFATRFSTSATNEARALKIIIFFSTQPGSKPD